MNKRHQFLYRFFRHLVILFCKIVFGYKYKKAENLPENYIVISNHNTDYDMLFVASSFPRQMYFVGSEHIARWGLLSKLIIFAFAPIMRPKGTSAASTVMEMIRKARKGENVCLFAEGVRSWDGVTCPITPSTARLIKTAGCGLVTYKIVGGYFVSPMWSGASIRKGHLYGEPVHILTKEDLAEMTPAQIQTLIEEDLYEDAYARQLQAPKPYKSKAPAEHLENLLYLCPQCGALDAFSSEKDTVTCKCCSMQFRYNLYGMLENCPFETVRDFAQWQKEQMKEHVSEDITYTSPSAVLNSIHNHEETLITQGPLSLTPEKLCCGDMEFPLSSITDLAMYGQRALVFTANKQYYEILPADGSNVLKYLMYYEHCKQPQKVKAR